MYNELDKLKIREFERNSFRTIKNEENKNRKLPKTEDILYTSDFDFEFFSNKGDSGLLLLATNKRKKDEKYVVKHEYYDCACNEYMYYKIGTKLGVNIALVKLFIVNDKENIFKSDFVCGIKYLENSERALYDYVKNSDEYYKMISLEMLFDEDDGIEILKYNNELYRIDTTAAFSLSNYYIYPLAYSYNKNGINIKEFAAKKILEHAERKSYNKISLWKQALKRNTDKYGQNFSECFIKTFKQIENVKENDIEEWTNILTFIYPDIIGEYYKIYFKTLKLEVKAFLNVVENQELVGM